MIAAQQKMCVDETIRITVYGVAQPAGSKRGFAFKRKNGSTGVAISDANPKSREFKNVVSDAAREAYHGPLLQGPLDVTMIFVRPRLKGHYRKDGTVKPAFVDALPTSKPDVLKLARGVEDALSKIVYLDDSQIVDERIRKVYGEPARVEIEIRQL